MVSRSLTRTSSSTPPSIAPRAPTRHAVDHRPGGTVERSPTGAGRRGPNAARTGQYGWVTSPERAGRRDRLSVAHRNHATGQRPARRRQRGPQRPGRLRQPLVRRRLAARTGRADRLRAPLRAPDVRGVGARREDRAHAAGAGQRRLAQRHHQPGPDELLRDACRPSTSSWRSGWRPTGWAAWCPALTQETLDNQREVVKNERRQRYDNVPVRRRLAAPAAAAVPAGAPVPPRHDRVDGGPERGRAWTRSRRSTSSTTRRTTPC